MGAKCGFIVVDESPLGQASQLSCTSTVAYGVSFLARLLLPLNAPFVMLAAVVASSFFYGQRSSLVTLLSGPLGWHQSGVDREASEQCGASLCLHAQRTVVGAIQISAQITFSIRHVSELG